MTRPNYRKLQRAIAQDDKRGVEARWLYGRTLLSDPRKMSPTGKSLRHGAVEALIADATAVGSKLTEREIQYRLQCARAYATLAEIRTALCGFGSWSELREAGFPPVKTEPEQQSLEDVIDELEKTDRQEHEQLSMFPEIVRGVPLQEASLRVLTAYAADMRAMTASFARRDEERAAHLADLQGAVGGDLDVLYLDAVAALLAERAQT